MVGAGDGTRTVELLVLVAWASAFVGVSLIHVYRVRAHPNVVYTFFDAVRAVDDLGVQSEILLVFTPCTFSCLAASHSGNRMDRDR